MASRTDFKASAARRFCGLTPPTLTALNGSYRGETEQILAGESGSVKEARSHVGNIVGVISIALFYLLPLVIVTLVILALVSGVAFGGARRNTLALLASGVYSLLTGGFYLYGMAASSYAKQDNAYLGNAYVGLFLLFAGVWLLSVGLADAGLAKWLVAVAGAGGDRRDCPDLRRALGELDGWRRGRGALRAGSAAGAHGGRCWRWGAARCWGGRWAWG